MTTSELLSPLTLALISIAFFVGFISKLIYILFKKKDLIVVPGQVNSEELSRKSIKSCSMYTSTGLFCTLPEGHIEQHNFNIQIRPCQWAHIKDDNPNCAILCELPTRHSGCHVGFTANGKRHEWNNK